ncbi:hypothetical protein GCM10017556_23550 [Micromonospora sagamiensis]|uniref:Uncharacterized protein Ymh n=1 Tax=Micromonospora sagamiensis TaxID=47875 RepID=A0A562WQ24_9ACTN|nr:uncharacterized protein Ymh [Micromonospora sagamiensis]BCL14616.1 hypothetical protein GCM10017556_23550 [Micromonospora sagamiensis]
MIQILAEAWGWLQAKCLIAWSFEDDSDHGFKITRRGHEFLRQGTRWLRAVARLDIDLVAELEFTARPQFLRGDYETAAFTAMKEVEVQVRRRAGLSDSLVGTSSFRKRSARLRTPTGTPGCSGAKSLTPASRSPRWSCSRVPLGLFKNPSSHRRVDFTDATEAVEVVLLADLLLRLLRKIPE